MGAGVAYPYKYFMLFEDEDFHLVDFYLCGWASGWYRTDSERFACRAHNGQVILSTPKMKVCIDFSGGCACIFCEPKEYKKGEVLKEYSIRKEVYDLFNKLIKESGVQYRKATSAWTSAPLKRYEP